MNATATALFQNISDPDCQKMFACMKSYTSAFHTGDIIYTYGGSRQSVGIILQGKVSVVRYEYSGSRTILEELAPGDIFGEALAFYLPEYSCITALCQKDCRILFLDYDHLLQNCAKVCPCHTQLIRNMLRLLSEKSRLLSERIEVLSQRSIRGKLLCFFRQQSAKYQSAAFTLPFSMIDFADFLSVNRSAMVREIKKMKEEGILEIEKRRITLLSDPQTA